jgi:phosphate acyltransferase
MQDPNRVIRIAVDAMGGDFAPEYPVLASAEAARENSNIEVIIVGMEKRIREILEKNSIDLPNIRIVNANEFITMEDLPSEVYKTKPDSSLNVALRMQRNKEAEALVSTSNTGAVLLHSTLKLGRISGIGRATISAMIPSQTGSTLLLDVGATVDCRPAHLFEYAIMGSIYSRDILKIDKPRVGLLSVGEEKVKGNEVTLEAFEMLEKAPINFIGNVEGRDITRGSVDVVVCDGFTGNIILKFAESVLDLLKARLIQYSETGFTKKIWAGMISKTLKKILKTFDYQEHGGAPLLGLNGVSVIGHGASTPYAIKKMIFRAEDMIRNDINGKIAEALKKIK